VGVLAQQTASVTYEYAALGRLIGADYDTGATIDYSYDLNGNRLQVASSVVGGGSLQTPYGGTPSDVDATLGLNDFPAREWDEGGHGIAFNDQPGHQGGEGTWRATDGVESYTRSSGPPTVMSYAQLDEWVEYTVNVAQAGDYEVTLLVAAGQGDRQVHIGFDKTGGQTWSQYQGGTTTASDTGNWNTFAETSPVTVSLDPGVQVMRLTFTGNATDTASFSIIPVGTAS